MKKYITLLLLAFVFISCKTTSLEKTDTLKIELEKAIADINGTVKIERVSGYKSNIIRADAEKILLTFKEITLMENGFKNHTDYSLFME